MQFLQFFCICMWCSITLWQFAKRAQITFDVVAKGNRSPFGSLFMRNLRIACNADHVNNIPLGELNLEKKKKNGCEFQILLTIHGFYTNEDLSNYTTFRPI
jgi:hypothetical protein